MENIFTRAARFIRERKMTRRWKRVITVLAAAVVFCTTYALILPAMTAERQPSCGMEEHTHTEECFENGIQVCGKEEHTHTEECYPKSKGLIVGVITRDQSSNTGTGTQGAGSDGSAGVQADGNTGAQNGGDAGAAADGNTGTQADGSAGAGSDGNAGTQNTGNAGAVTDGTAAGGEAGNGQQADGQQETAAAPEAKTADQLAQELGSLTLSGTWAEDTVAVAKAHERCREDSRAFVQAVLSYSGVQGMPDVSDGAGGYLGYAEWIRKLREAGLYLALSGNIPKAGDLVFLDQEENAEKLGHEDERVDHVGILVNVRIRGENGETLRDLMVLTAGADGLIGSSFYSMEDASNVNRIAGYAKLPEQPKGEPAEVLAEGQTEETKEAETGTEAPAEAGTEVPQETGAAEPEENKETETGTEPSPEAGAVPESNTEKSTDEDMETENDTEMSSKRDIKTPEEATESGTKTATEPTPGETAETGTGTELSSETDTELTSEAETDTELSSEEDTEPVSEAETDTELTTETSMEPLSETDTELSSEEDTEAETDTELSSEEESETETGTELSSEEASETETGTEESESDTDDWGWTWEDFVGQDAEEEESETDWDDWYEDETEEETEGGSPEVDTETSEDWEASVSDVELTGIWADDLTAVAQTQVGEKESTENYQIGKDGVQRGITRYGQWYGEPYGDWDAMFVSFCLNYAEVPHSSVPRAGSCTALAEMLKVYGLYAEPEEYKEAAKGDLVFLDTDADEAADHVGILTEVTEEGLTVVAGDVEDEVKSLTYAKGDAAVLGYGILPQKPAQKLYHKVYNDGNVVVTAEYTAEAMIPEQAVLVVSEVPQDDEIYKQHYETVREMMNAKEEEPETGTAEEEILSSTEGEMPEPETEQGPETELHLRIYNIGFCLDEQEVEPQAEVKISIEFLDDPNFAAGTDKVIRIKEGEEPEALGTTRSEEEISGQQTSKIEFTTKAF